MKRRIFEADHDDFRLAFRRFIDAEAVPHAQEWEAAGMVDPKFWRKAGDLGYLGFEAAPEFGGVGIDDFRFNAVIAEEVAASGMVGDGFALHNDIFAPYLLHHCNDEQRARWLPKFVSG